MSNKPTASEAASLAAADEIFMRCAPALLKGPTRGMAAEVIQREKAELLELLELLADGIDNASKVDVHKGMIAVFVDTDFFPKFKKAMAKHAERSVLVGSFFDSPARTKGES